MLTKQLKRTKAKVAKLLKRTKGGTVTKAQFNTELKKVEKSLKQLRDYLDGALGEISRVKRSGTRAVDTAELNLRLKDLGKRLQRICNHDNGIEPR
jgi:hypothetical protein